MSCWFFLDIREVTNDEGNEKFVYCSMNDPKYGESKTLEKR